MKALLQLLAAVLTITVYPIPATAQTFLTNGLVAYYSLNGDSLDHSGNTNDAVAMNGAAPATDRFGAPNGCYAFNGAGQYLVAPASSLPTTNRTVALWFKLNRADNRPSLLGYGGNGGADSFYMGLNTKGNQSYKVSTHWEYYTLDVPFTNGAPINAWYHWTVVMDDVGMFFYLNGHLFGSRSGVSQTYVAGRQLGMGAISSTIGLVPYIDDNTGWLDGYLDDVRIYNRALSPAEVLAVYAADGGNGDDVSPFFTQQPASRVISFGDTCTFAASAAGTPEPVFQWRFQGQNIVSATNPTYSIPSAGLSSIGWYDLVVTNRAGIITSTPVTLNFCDIKMLAAVFVYSPIGSTNMIQAASSLQPLSWRTLTNVTVTTQPFIYVDYASETNRMQIYRSVPLP